MTEQAPLPYAIPAPVPGRGGLTAIGVVSILIGALSGCVAVTTPLSLVAGMAARPGMPAGSRPDVRTALVAFLMYAAVAGGFIAIGIGCVRGKRWVRPIVLSVAWPWLIVGTVSSVFWLTMLPQARVAMTQAMVTAMPPNAPPPPTVLVPIMLAAMSVMFVAMGMILPGVYVGYFARRKVAATLNLLDSQASWADRVPVPVLGLVVWLALGAASLTFVLVRPLVPVFGTFVVGWPAAVIVLGMMAVLAYAAREAYARRWAGWWIPLVLSVVGPVSYGMTVALRGMDEYYRLMGVPEAQVEATRTMGLGRMAAMGLVGPVLAVGYLMYVRRYFGRGGAERPGGELAAD
jgi:hypothetical protein